MKFKRESWKPGIECEMCGVLIGVSHELAGFISLNGHRQHIDCLIWLLNIMVENGDPLDWDIVKEERLKAIQGIDKEDSNIFFSFENGLDCSATITEPD